MKENKFRAWDTFTKKMIFEGFHVIGEITCFNGIEQYGYENPNPKYDSSLLRLNDFIIMQFIGKTDKHRVDIYEDDIINYISSGNKAKVYYDPYSCSYQPNFNSWISDEIEVIGNIYENPKLLDVKWWS